MNHPLLLLLMTAAGFYAARLWNGDRRAARRGAPNPGALPGATDAPLRATLIALAGVLVLLAAETLGEKALGLTAHQSSMTWFFGLYSVLAAPIMEEIIFRGYLVLNAPARCANYQMMGPE